MGQPIKHGMAKTTIYHVWKSMIYRCEKEANIAYYRYGGRGIKVCERWQDFENFYNDVGDNPKGMQLDRKDNDGNYEPGNCRWTTRTENVRNSTTCKLNTEAVKVIKYAIKYKGYTAKRLADLHGVHEATIHSIKQGVSWADVTID